MVLAALMVVTVLGTSTPPSGNFVPGEVMVKFAEGLEADAAVERVSKTFPIDLQALAPHVERLEEQTNTPLSVSQVTSGKWVVLKVDVDRLTSRLVDQLKTHRNVERVALTEAGRAFIGYSPPNKVAVKFVQGSPEAKTVTEKLSNQGEREFKGLVSRLEERVASPLSCEAAAQDELLVQIDLPSLTVRLQERLKALPSIEATQLNYVMKAF